MFLVFTTFQNDLAIDIDVALGEEKGEVVRKAVNRLNKIAEILKVLKPKLKSVEPR